MTASPSPAPRPLDTAATISIVLCCLVWGLSQVAVKTALPQVPPLTQAFVRSAGATLLLMAWMRRRGIAWIGRDGTEPAALGAGLLFSAEFAFLYVGLQWTAASRITVFLYTAPLFVAIGLSPLLGGRERLGPLQWGGLLLAFAGVVLAFADGLRKPGAGGRQALGDALGLCAGLGWAATTIVVRRTALAHVPAERVLLAQLAVSSVALGIAAALLGQPWLPAAGALTRPLVAASLLYQIVAVSFVSYLVWFRLIQRHPATLIASFSLLTPIAGVALGIALLHEPASVRLLAGAALVLGGIALVNRGR